MGTTILDIDTRKVICELKGHSRSINSAQFSMDGNFVVTSAPNDTKIWDARTGENIQTLECAGRVRFASFVHDGRTIVTDSFDTIEVWRFYSPNEVIDSTHREMPIRISEIAVVRYKKTWRGRYRCLHVHTGGVRFWDIFMPGRTAVRMKAHLKRLNANITDVSV